MFDRFRELGYGRIAIADDTPANLDAAKRVAICVDGIEFEFYESGQPLIERIPAGHSDYGLVLTDLQMGRPIDQYAGLDVVAMGMSYLIPTFVATGGAYHRGQEVLRVLPLRRVIEGIGKERPEAWKKIFGYADEAFGSDRTVQAMLRLRKAKGEAPHGFIGVQGMKIVGQEIHDIDAGYGNWRAVNERMNRIEIDTYKRCGEPKNAADAAMHAGFPGEAIDLYAESGHPKMAAKAALAADQPERAVELLSDFSPGWAAEIAEKHGMKERAIHLYETAGYSDDADRLRWKE